MDQNEQYNSNIENIRTSLPIAVLLENLAEEASELSQSALKKARILRGDNPTPVSYSDADEHLVEELGDVLLCCAILDIHPNLVLMERKLDRWDERLSNRYAETVRSTESLKNSDVYDFSDWLDEQANFKTKKDVDLMSFAEHLCTEMPIGDDSLKLAKVIFDGISNIKKKDGDNE